MENKIKKLEELPEIIDKLKAEKKKIVLCHGVFDLLHIGHIRYLTQAKTYGDVLVVTLSPDKFVDKGSHRPAFTEGLRQEALASLGPVDYVAINKWPTAENTLRLLKPDFYAKGSEYRELDSDPTGKIALEVEAVKEVGAELVFVEDIVFSSSNLINKYLSMFPKEIDDYLEIFRRRYSLDQIIEILDKMSQLKVLVVGDTILDEYQFCDAIGKSSKDPTLALQYRSHDLFAGGVLAVANHVASFAESVGLVSVIGEYDTYDEFINSQLKTNITSKFYTQKGSPTLMKRRFIDGYSMNKLFEVYIMDDSGLQSSVETQMIKHLEKEFDRFDLVVASDFGHGAISSQVIELLSKKAPYLAVNTQANAGNRGFNTINKYQRADFVCIAEHEFRLATRNKTGMMRTGIAKMASNLGSSAFIVTKGRKGCSIADNNASFFQTPAFASKVIDRVGAGDAFFAITALAAKVEAPHEIIAFLGNVVGALAVEILGNKKPMDRQRVQKLITSFMK